MSNIVFKTDPNRVDDPDKPNITRPEARDLALRSPLYQEALKAATAARMKGDYVAYFSITQQGYADAFQGILDAFDVEGYYKPN